MSQQIGEKLFLSGESGVGFHAWGFGLGYLESFIKKNKGP